MHVTYDTSMTQKVLVLGSYEDMLGHIHSLFMSVLLVKLEWNCVIKISIRRILQICQKLFGPKHAGQWVMICLAVPANFGIWLSSIVLAGPS